MDFNESNTKTMKRLCLLICTLWMASFNAEAKSDKPGAYYVSIGPVAGFGHSWVSNLNLGDAHFKPSGQLGISLLHSHTEHLALGAQLLISHEGYSKEKTVF